MISSDLWYDQVVMWHDKLKAQVYLKLCCSFKIDFSSLKHQSEMLKHEMIRDSIANDTQARAPEEYSLDSCCCEALPLYTGIVWNEPKTTDKEIDILAKLLFGSY